MGCGLTKNVVPPRWKGPGGSVGGYISVQQFDYLSGDLDANYRALQGNALWEGIGERYERVGAHVAGRAVLG